MDRAISAIAWVFFCTGRLIVGTFIGASVGQVSLWVMTGFTLRSSAPAFVLATLFVIFAGTAYAVVRGMARM